ncbi:Progranulin like protein [Argiope bruennichi]|uniref:Progranulin like protein n=1 Tax=Argiope bruennichi TaxID=94029 RepID=A0A8T0EDZ8_ARGBR|nr:Progranulin like protein [Argiope bruennichi]
MSFWIILMFVSLAYAVKKECPGGTFSCPDSATCCELADKSYGCCPIENAVCCDDHIHCCPANTKCATDLCLQSNNKSMEFHLLRSKDVVCDDQSICPDDATCCKNPQTQKFGCCPMENAVCCDDGLHCCPEGTTCNLEERKCDGDGYVTHMYDSHKKSFESIISNITLSFLRSNKGSSVICPDEQSQCPDGYTCCKLPNQDYGCCPFIKASCCKDGLHCCPEYMHCDATSQYCSQGLRNVTSLRHIPAKKISENICPDHSFCEDFETCCKMSNSTYGCCRYANATCCSDLLSCCPSDMVCDIKQNRCLRKEDLVVAFLNNLV